MSSHEQHHHPTADETLQAGHELTDVEPAPVLKFVAFLAVIMVGVAAFSIVFYNYLDRREAREKPARYPMAEGSARALPPPPRLQTYTFQDVKDLRQEERRLLENYEWVDKNAGTVRIPIERAIDVLAERGLPYRQPGQAAPAAAVPASGSARPTGAAGGTQPVGGGGATPPAARAAAGPVKP